MFGRELAYRYVLDHAQAGAAGPLHPWSREAPGCEACESLISRQQASLRYALSRAAGSRALLRERAELVGFRSERHGPWYRSMTTLDARRFPTFN